MHRENKSLKMNLWIIKTKKNYKKLKKLKVVLIKWYKI